MPSTGTTPVVDVVVVNYNAGKTLVRCVQSVLDQGVGVRITVADNASSDGSIATLRRSIPPRENLVIRAHDQNLGFARAVNAAVTDPGTGAAPYLLILNPDCEMFPESLRNLCTALDQEAAAALAGPIVVDRQGRAMRGTLRRFPRPSSALLTFSGLWRLGRWFPGLEGVEESGRLPQETTPAEAVSGACMLLRRNAFLELGGLDEGYGLHCEDLDLMYRLRQRGFHCLFVPAARVYHDQGVSSSSRPLWVHWQKHLGMQRFFRKFQAEQYGLLMRWLVISGIWLRWLVTFPLAWYRS